MRLVMSEAEYEEHRRYTLSAQDLAYLAKEEGLKKPLKKRLR